MKFCSHCGKELLDEAVMCPGCGCMVAAAPVQAIPVQAAPVEPTPVQPSQAAQPKKFCSHCGKELMLAAVMCPGCGCMVEQPAPQQQVHSAPRQAAPKKALKPVTYEEVIQNAKVTNIISAALLVASAFVWWFFSVYGGAFIALAAELVAVIPNTKLQNLFKRNGLGKANTIEIKAITKDLKAKNTAFRFSFFIAIIALVCGILYLFIPEFI